MSVGSFGLHVHRVLGSKLMARELAILGAWGVCGDFFCDGRIPIRKAMIQPFGRRDLIKETEEAYRGSSAREQSYALVE